MSKRPEDKARETIDGLLTTAGWIVQSRDEANVVAGRALDLFSQIATDLGV